MPLIHVYMRAGKPAAYRQAILDGLYRALRDSLDVPEGDHFMTITEHLASDFRTGGAYGVLRSEDVIYIDITVFNTRTAAQKATLFRRIVEVLNEKPGVRPEDVFIVVHDAPKENWSVGNGLAVA
ncbi:tautomerase family protein [Aquabacter sp. L1I39]|uniref:tautomerase family protein n=1 Tax=Aquabacter sp. L1I39 TaxID=2820278 RepID=UPI001ADB3AAE|nr:tautomerase family protein [Aquabacter sp. L1I39]QTL01630.1 tautomerase family protein [Aquabacter sp. L1I39]